MVNQWKRVQGDDDSDLNVWDYQRSPELIGELVEIKENVGPNKSRVYVFEVDGKLVSVWGSFVLDSRLKNVINGEEVKIQYLGKAKSQKTGRDYHNFDVWRKEPEIQVGEKKIEKDLPWSDNEEPTEEELNKIFGDREV